MRWLFSLFGIYLILILGLVCVLFAINFGYSDNLFPRSSIFGLGPTSFKTKSSDFWFAMFTESIIVFVTFLVVILFIKMGEEKDRKPVYKEACDDAYHIYDEIYKLIYHIMAYRMKIEMLEPYKKWLKSCGSIKNKIFTYETIKAFFEDIHTNKICINRRKLGIRIDFIYSETENYLQRFGAFLTSEATGNEGSELQQYFNNIRRFSRKLKRLIDSQQTDELSIEIRESRGEYVFCLGSDSEMIDILSTIIKNMKDHHPELKKMVEKSGKSKTLNFDFLTMKYFMNELDVNELNRIDSGNINRDDCILTWAILFEQFKGSCDRSGASGVAFSNAEFDFWCMYWDYRHRLLEDAKTKCNRNHLNYSGYTPRNLPNTPNGPKALAKAIIREERKVQHGSRRDDQNQDSDQGTVELQKKYKVLDVCNNDKEAGDVFRWMEGSSNDVK